MDKLVLWRNVFGEPVDLDDIDREYALNILCMVLLRYGRQQYTSDEVRDSELVQKLRDVVLNGRQSTPRDRMRARYYNARCRWYGLPYRVKIR